jgi:hypothetical protein
MIAINKKMNFKFLKQQYLFLFLYDNALRIKI